MTRVGFIGLGNQGTPIARRIVEHGHQLALWARRPESTAPFADTTATVVPTPADVGAASDVVGICVFTDADVQDVLLGSHGVLAGMAPGGVVAIHSTVLPDTCASLAQHAGERGIAVVDAPVSGGPAAAAAGRLLLMAGGDDAASPPADRCSRPSPIRSSTWVTSAPPRWRRRSTTCCWR